MGTLNGVAQPSALTGGRGEQRLGHPTAKLLGRPVERAVTLHVVDPACGRPAG